MCRSRSASTDRAVATAVAALAANSSRQLLLAVAEPPAPRRAGRTRRARRADARGRRAGRAARSRRRGRRGLVGDPEARATSAIALGRPLASTSPATVPATGSDACRALRGDLARAGRDDAARSPSASRSTTTRARTSARPRLTTSSSTRSRSVSEPTRARDRRRRLEPLDRALELGGALARAPVEVRVLDRDRRPVGEHGRSTSLVAPRRTRRPPSRSGTGCPTPRRGSAAARRGTSSSAGARPGSRTSAGGADVGEAQRPRVVDQHAEDAAAAREVADRRVRRGVDAAREEALQRRRAASSTPIAA